MNLVMKKEQGRPDPVLTLVRGDSRTKAINIIVGRYDDIDLSGLNWHVNVINAAGETDLIPIASDAVEIDDKRIMFEWPIYGVATAADGLTEFYVTGAAGADEPVVWSSRNYYLEILPRKDATEAGDEENPYPVIRDLVVEWVQESIRDDDVQPDMLWSSERIVECFPTVDVSGNPAIIEGIGGTPLNVTTDITLTQEGSGDASSANVRNIANYNSLSLTHTHGKGSVQHMADIDPVYVCSGVYAWDTGLLTEDMILDVFDGSADEVITKTTHADYPHGYVFALNVSAIVATASSSGTDKRDQSKCNRAKFVTNLRGNYQRDTFSVAANGTYIMYTPPSDAGDTIDSFRAWLATHPVQLAYYLATPRVTTHASTGIYAMTGSNTFSGTGNEFTVRGKTNPATVIATLEQRIAALEEMVNGG